MKKRIHVVAAVIEDNDGHIFLAKRPIDKHQGGLWEFPGGKVETGEGIFDALKRELYEEIGIEVTAAKPLIQVAHDYPDKSILLDTWRVTQFTGEAHGKENQPIQWVKKSELKRFSFPEANKSIVLAVSLPSYFAITPQPDETDAFFDSIKRTLNSGVRLIQLRTKTDLSQETINKIVKLVDDYDAKVVLNSPKDVHLTLGTHGRHLTSQQLLALKERPFSRDYLLSASCHNHSEIQQAIEIDVDFIVLAPVLETNSHPGAPKLGWDNFRELSQKSPVPVYALGGMQKEMLDIAIEHGAQGIAGISAFF